MSQDVKRAVASRMKKRYRAEARFKAYCVGALCMAIAFLMFFFYDMIQKGYSAFVQAEIQVEFTYTQENVDFPTEALPQAEANLISRGWYRGLPRELRDNPELEGQTVTTWAVARTEVDQFLKGHSEKLSEDELRWVRQLQDEGRLDTHFNTYFFANGDSKIPVLAGLKSAFIGSLFVMLVTLVVSFPIGVMTAIYLEEFAPDNRFTQGIEININNLAAVPSILFGLLGLAIFINFFGVPRSSALAGGLTLSLMTLPVIIISTRAALRAVPQNIRHGALAVGASRWQAVRDHVLPASLPGILTGTIIGIAQAMGETAPLLIIGMIAYIPDAPTGVTQAATVLPAQIFTWAGMPERAYVERTAAGILVLLSLLISLNAAAVFLRQRFERRW